MIEINEIKIQDINEFWELHIKYLIEDEMLQSEEERSYFSGKEHRTILEEHMVRDENKQHMAYFCRNNERIVCK